jgi:hypothetical protein
MFNYWIFNIILIIIKNIFIKYNAIFIKKLYDITLYILYYLQKNKILLPVFWFIVTLTIRIFVDINFNSYPIIYFIIFLFLFN